MIRVGILTSFDESIASHHALHLLNHKNSNFELVGIVKANALPKKNAKFYRRKLKKALQIGLWGTLNGIKMRQWYGPDVENQLECPPLRAIATKHKVTCVFTDGLNSDETRKALRDLNVDVAVSLGNSFIAPSVFRIPRLGMINIHHEILPDYQNAQSVIWQLYNGSNQTGYTIHQIERKIDTGRILFQEHLPIRFADTLASTVSSTHANQWNSSAEGLRQTLENFETLLRSSKVQGQGCHYTTPSRKQFRIIERNWSQLAQA